MGQCMAMGVAAGITSALAHKNQTSIREVPFSKLHRELLNSGAILEITK